jgi:hypothetical protein
MRTFVIATLALYCGVDGAGAALAPPAAPCPDTERQFVDLTLAHLVRQGLIDARDLFAHRAPGRRAAPGGGAASPDPLRAGASGVDDGA